MLRVLIFISLLFTVVSCNAVEINLILKSIEAIKMQERNNDEVYLIITQYLPNGKAEEYRLPTFPHHWPAAILPQISDLSIYSQDLAQGDEIKLVVSLLENDASLFNASEHLGSAVVHIVNQENKITAKWEIPKYRDQPNTAIEDIGNMKLFKFQGIHGTYQLGLLLNISITM